MHRAKSILAALAAVALSATAVFAAAGTGPADAAKDGLAGAADASGRSVPVRAESPDTATEHQANKAPEANESPDIATTKDANAAHPDNHGALVSVAAQKATPDGLRESRRLRPLDRDGERRPRGGIGEDARQVH
jgi:hypothetical protein